MNTISEKALALLPALLAVLEAQPDSAKWSAMLAAVWFAPFDVVELWAGLPQGALAGAIGNVARKEEAEATLTNRLEDASRWVMIWVDCDGFDDLEAIQAVMGGKP